MTISYVMDAGQGRRADKNSFLTAEEAIEKALEAARKLQRAVSVWEWDSERKGEWPQVPAAHQHYCLVFPDGSTQKSSNGENPFKVVLDESASHGTESEESVEKQLGLPTITLGSVAMKIDEVIAGLAKQAGVTAEVAKLHKISERVAAAAAVRRQRSKKIVAAFTKKSVYTLSGEKYILAGVSKDTGEVHLLPVRGSGGQYITVDAYTLAKTIVKADQEAEAHHLSPGDIAVLDEKDRVFVLDSADETYVVMNEGKVETVPDDVTRIRKFSDAGDNDAKKVRRVWQAFYRQLLRFFDVDTVDQLDAEQKSRFFDMARRKWPKVQKQMLEKSDEPSEQASDPAEQPAEQPAQPAPQQPQTQSSTQVKAGDEDEYEDTSPSVEFSEIMEVVDDDLKKALQGKGWRLMLDWEWSEEDEKSINFFGGVDSPHDETEYTAFLEEAKQFLASTGMFSKLDIVKAFGGFEQPVLKATMDDDYLSGVDDSLSEGWDDPSDPTIPGGPRPSIPGRRRFFGSSWSSSPTLLSYCMDILGDDVEAAARLAMNFMAASLRDATMLRAMKSMKKFDGKELPTGWFEVATILAETGKRSNVKASKAIDLTPPRDVQKIAARALARAAKEGFVLPGVTAQHAKLLVSGKVLSLEAAERMHLFLTRHKPVAQSEILWEAWGGHAGKRWVEKLAALVNPKQSES